MEVRHKKERKDSTLMRALARFYTVDNIIYKSYYVVHEEKIKYKKVEIKDGSSCNFHVLCRIIHFLLRKLYPEQCAMKGSKPHSLIPSFIYSIKGSHSTFMAAGVN